MRAVRRGQLCCGLVWLVGALLAPRAAAQEERFREREVLDPQSDEWVEAPHEPNDTADDVLSQARALLAERRPREAYRLLNKWIDAHPDHERYAEAVLLLGEANFERRWYFQAYERFEEVAESTAGELFYQAVRRSMDVARAFLSGEKRVIWRIFRIPAYDDGIEILDRVWERVPGTRLGEQALKLKADYFFENGDMDLAQDEYLNLAREYPNGRYAQYALMRSAESAAAAFPGVKFDDRALLDSQERYEQIRALYPDLARRENVDERLEGIRQQRAEKDLYIARWYERTRQSGAAEFYYRLILRDWPDTLAAAEARSRLRAMGVELQEGEPPLTARPAAPPSRPSGAGEPAEPSASQPVEEPQP